MNLQSKTNSDKLKLPPISAMDDFLPTRTWAPPPSASPQLDQWKSPPYKNRNELSRDSSYKTCLYSNTSPIIMQQTSPQQQIDPPESPQQHGSSYFQYNTSSNNNINNAPSPSSINNNLYTTNRVDNDIEEVVRQCHTLCDNMIQRKTQFINSSTSSYQDMNSTRPWLDDMIGRANEVLNALLRLRKHQMASEQQQQQQLSTAADQNEYVTNEQSDPHTWRIGSSSPSNAVNNNTRQRKRGKRPAFQGRCHSCNISETPEWRRGPDGARTLCNACGLHYAKLARKQQESRGMSNLSSKRLDKLTPPPVNNILPTG